MFFILTVCLDVAVADYTSRNRRSTVAKRKFKKVLLYWTVRAEGETIVLNCMISKVESKYAWV